MTREIVNLDEVTILFAGDSGNGMQLTGGQFTTTNAYRIKEKFAKTPEFVEANTRVLKAGHAYGETAEIFTVRYEV